MDTEQLWNLFCDTGDPVCWLYYTAMKQEPVGNDTR
jgi:hypothetical protein